MVRVKRIVRNAAAADPKAAAKFYHGVLGLDVVMDHGWIVSFGTDAATTPQISFATEGGNGTPVPDISIEVDDLDAVLARLGAAGMAPEYGPANEPWGVRRIYVRDPFGQLVNILQHD